MSRFLLNIKSISQTWDSSDSVTIKNLLHWVWSLLGCLQFRDPCWPHWEASNLPAYLVWPLQRTRHPTFWQVSFSDRPPATEKAWSHWTLGWLTPLRYGVIPRAYLYSLVCFPWASPGRGCQTKAWPLFPPNCPTLYEREWPWLICLLTTF